RQIGAHRLRLTGAADVVVADGVVDVEAEGLAFAVAVEQRRIDPSWQRGGEEGVVATERVENQRTQCPCGRVRFGQLQVLLGLRRLVTGGGLAVGPVRFLQALAGYGHLLTREYIRDMQQHRVALWRGPRRGAGGGRSQNFTLSASVAARPGAMAA